MSVNKVDYDVLDHAKVIYADQAAALDAIISTLVQTNGDLQAGWTNQTSDAFIDRFETDHKIALQNVRDAIQDISDYIQQYVSNQIDIDTQGASAISR